MLENIIEISVSMSGIIILMIILSHFLDKKYRVSWKYWIWLVIAIRLIIPFNISLPNAPIEMTSIESNSIVYEKKELVNSNEDIDYDNEKFADQYVAVKTNPMLNDNIPVIDTNDILLIIWLSVAIIFLGYHIFSYVHFRNKILKYCEIYIIDGIDNKYRELEKIKIMKCSKVSTPMIIGFITPIMILPNIDYANEELDLIIKHELVHFKRHDLWYKLLLIVANSMHWFNPFVYLMVKYANRDLEYSCDDIVVNDKNIDFKKQYSNTILKSMKLKEE